MIQIQYFGILKEQLSCETEQMHWAGGDTEQLLHQLRARNAVWADALAAKKVFKIAVNHVLTHEVTHIPDGAQVGFLPPVTGG